MRERRRRRVSRLGWALALIAADMTAASPPALAKPLTLGSAALRAQLHGTGIGTVRPRVFNAGGFPIYRGLRWSAWGAPAATALGINVPDGPYPARRVQLRAHDIGLCDRAQAYRRLKTRTRTGTGWSAWQMFDPRGAGTTGTSGGTLCLATGRTGSVAPVARSRSDDFLVPIGARDTGFGPFKEIPFVEDTAQRLRRRFGAATSSTATPGSSCTLRWSHLGITATVTGYGTRPLDACRHGTFVSARLTDGRWHTPGGIHPGTSRAVAARQSLLTCTRATCTVMGYALDLAGSECSGTSLFPRVIAEVPTGRVTALRIDSHSCD